VDYNAKLNKMKAEAMQEEAVKSGNYKPRKPFNAKDAIPLEASDGNPPKATAKK
jgi:hypothetical protein